MQAHAASAAVCPECGTRLEGGFSRNLGRCMAEATIETIKNGPYIVKG